MTRRRFLRSGALIGLALTGSVVRVAQGAEPTVEFKELYAKQSVLGMEFSPRTKELAGHTVRILGYLAPPLKPDVRFFVLTRAPVALCPFCNSDADWPSDIVVVYPRGTLDTASDGLPVAVTGTLEVGSKTDAQTGFVSLVRVVDADFTVVR
jgi:hypothetical protein